MKTVQSLLALGLLVAPLALPQPAAAQDYPSQDVHFIVGFAPGSGPDVIARFVSEKMRARLNRTVIVENKVGAGGNIASEYVARAKPDGYTIYITGGTALAASPYLMKNPPFDVMKSFDVVATISIQPTLMVVGANSPAKNLAELTKILKEKGEKASYGTAFPSARVLGALYKKMEGLKAVEVQYRTSKDWLNDLNHGDVDFAIIDAVSGVGLAKQGSVRIVAGSADERSSSLPDVPTMKESGLDISVPGWWAAFTPAGVPQPIINKLHDDFSAVSSSPEAKEFFHKLANDPYVTTLDQAKQIYLKEYKAWGDYVKEAHIEPQG
jgi:tripartite-type tricarboxylate transporter receptor subunit TctC